MPATSITGSLKQPPFTYDIVGSFLRPAKLKQARADFDRGAIDEVRLEAVEDECIHELVNKEILVGLKAVTDGEFRRRMWHMDFFKALEGVEEIPANEWSVNFKGLKPTGAQLRFTGKVGFPDDHPFIEHYRHLKCMSGEPISKFTIPSPSMLHLIPCVRGHKTYWPIPRYDHKQELLLEDITSAYKDAVLKFYHEGCRYLQLDDTSWGEFCDKEKRAEYEAAGFDLDKLENRYVDMINEVLSVKPDDMTITMHVCRGNYRSSWFSSGGYDPIAPILFARCNVDGFFLEYDTERAGGFEPLKYMKDQIVVLGLITTKTPELEDEDAVIERIHEAEKYVPLEHLRLSPQCGFSSTVEGNNLTEDQQWEKVKLVKRIADRVWGPQE